MSAMLRIEPELMFLLGRAAVRRPAILDGLQDFWIMTKDAM
jgi:hypothetical protein